jgi:hypothetical protein
MFLNDYLAFFGSENSFNSLSVLPFSWVTMKKGGMLIKKPRLEKGAGLSSEVGNLFADEMLAYAVTEPSVAV